MKAYKLVTKRADGSYGPLFINRPQRLQIGEKLQAESYPTKGYALRPGWHCCKEPNAPHLKMEGRTWLEVEIEDYVTFPRPNNQGGEWLIAQVMTIVKEVTRSQNERDNARESESAS